MAKLILNLIFILVWECYNCNFHGLEKCRCPCFKECFKRNHYCAQAQILKVKITNPIEFYVNATPNVLLLMILILKFETRCCKAMDKIIHWQRAGKKAKGI